MTKASPKKRARSATKVVQTGSLFGIIELMKTQLTEYNYGTLTRNVQLLIDESFAERVIPASDSVRLLDQIVEEIDLMPLERAIKRTGRKHRTNPVTMLKIVIYSAMQHNYSSRWIAQSCNRDINYIWLLNGEAAPSLLH